MTISAGSCGACMMLIALTQPVEVNSSYSLSILIRLVLAFSLPVAAIRRFLHEVSCQHHPLRISLTGPHARWAFFCPGATRADDKLERVSRLYHRATREDCREKISRVCYLECYK